MSNVIELTAESFEREVLQSEIPVLVDFWAPWCGPCRMMGPVLEELSEEMKGTLKITKLNVDESANQELAMTYRVQGIPNMQIFRGGSVIKELVGARPKEFLRNELKGVV